MTYALVDRGSGTFYFWRYAERQAKIRWNDRMAERESYLVCQGMFYISCYSHRDCLFHISGFSYNTGEREWGHSS